MKTRLKKFNYNNAYKSSVFILPIIPGALIIAKWVDHTITLNGSAEKVKTKLDNMADRVRSIVQEQAQPMDCNAVSKDPEHLMKILEGIKQVMYEEERFSGNSQDYYSINNSLITEVGFFSPLFCS